MDLTDRNGVRVMAYRYDAFGNLFTQMAAPYNNIGFTGKSHDDKASLMDFSARWYSPNLGRFTTVRIPTVVIRTYHWEFDVEK